MTARVGVGVVSDAGSLEGALKIGFGDMEWTYLHIFVLGRLKASGIRVCVGVECDVFS